MMPRVQYSCTCPSVAYVASSWTVDWTCPLWLQPLIASTVCKCDVLKELCCRLGLSHHSHQASAPSKPEVAAEKPAVDYSLWEGQSIGAVDVVKPLGACGSNIGGSLPGLAAAGRLLTLLPAPSSALRFQEIGFSSLTVVVTAASALRLRCLQTEPRNGARSRNLACLMARLARLWCCIWHRLVAPDLKAQF